MYKLSISSSFRQLGLFKKTEQTMYFSKSFATTNWSRNLKLPSFFSNNKKFITKCSYLDKEEIFYDRFMHFTNAHRRVSHYNSVIFISNKNIFLQGKIEPKSYKQHFVGKKLFASNIGTFQNVNRLFSTVSSDNCNKINEAATNPEGVNAENLYTTSKNVLHNMYDVVARHMKNSDLKLRPAYTAVKTKNKTPLWSCTYHIKWPECTKISAVGHTKQEASHKAAVSTLLWLQKKGKITKTGHPVLIEKNEMKEILKQSRTALLLDAYIVEQMKIITNIYNTQFVSKLQDKLNTPKKNDETDEEITTPDQSHKGVVKKKLFPFQKYIAKEKVILPISEYKEDFIKLLKENQVIIIKGEPGCGKSTRIPQYVLELWAREGLKEGEPCQIAVTQPRRIAAISLANRVSDERDEQCGHVVGYQVRFKTQYNTITGRILYCTTGILLKHLQSDINLSRFSHVLLDEAHERDINTDLLLNLLRNALCNNPKLKFIVMSATIDVELFRGYLNNPPVLHIPGFTYPVHTCFLDDLKGLSLNKSFDNSLNNETPTVIHEDVVKVINYIHKTKDAGAILCFLPGWEDIMKIERLIPSSNDMVILCLHSRVQDSDQRKIFAKVPPGVRKIILSTNIAETSVTVDDVVYVIDTGIHKENRFDSEKGISSIDNYWISQSCMSQRKGRAGRVQPGESYHLYTKEKYELLEKYTIPEILRTSLTKIVLDSKVYSNNKNSLEFMGQLVTPPDINSIRRAVQELTELKLLDDFENLTPLGRALSSFQLEPKLAKILVNSLIYKCVTPVVDIVTIFSTNTELFNNSLIDKEYIKNIKAQGNKHSDHIAMMELFEAWLKLMQSYGEETAQRYCLDANLIHHRLITINKLRKLHFDYLHNDLQNPLPIDDVYSDNSEMIKGVLFSGVGNLLRYRSWDVVKDRFLKRGVFLKNDTQKATITSESVNYKRTTFPSEFLVYLNEIRSRIRRTTLIRECSIINPTTILLFTNKDLVIKEVTDEDDKVILNLKGTKLEFFCTKEVALHLQNCKEAIDSIYQYLIFQMTEDTSIDPEVNTLWDTILKHIHLILLRCSAD